MSDSPRKPKAFTLDSKTDEEPSEQKKATPSRQTKQQTKASPAAPRKPKAVKKDQSLEIISDDLANDMVDALEPPELIVPKAKGFRWLTLFFAAIGGLISLWFGLAVESLLLELFARHQWLGWFATGLAILAGLAVLVLLFREASALSRMKTVERIRGNAVVNRENASLKSARKFCGELTFFYSADAKTAKAREAIAEHSENVMDGPDLIDLAEKEMFAALDAEATEIIMNAAKRVSLVTAVSPRAIVDVTYVLYENMRLIRKLSQHYGGRPGTIGFLRLSKTVVTHLAATGAIAIGDGLIQQAIGHGLAARLSARLGEGVVNGLLTVRVGISAMDICRPMPFHALDRPGVNGFVSQLMQFSGTKKDTETH